MGRLQLQDAVRFVGMVSDRIRDAYYGESDCLWIASRAELQCCAALEAMAAGCPVVAARAGALPETVPDGIAGRLFTPGNPNEIVEIMKGLCRQPERRRLSDGARTVALKHGIARVCSDTLEIYRACV